MNLNGELYLTLPWTGFFIIIFKTQIIWLGRSLFFIYCWWAQKRLTAVSFSPKLFHYCPHWNEDSEHFQIQALTSLQIQLFAGLQKIWLTMTNITPKGRLIHLHTQFSSWMCLSFKCQYKQLAEASQPRPHNCSQYLEFRMACHVGKGWEWFGRFGGALVNSTDCLAVLDGFVGSAVTNLYFCNKYLCCFNCKGNRLRSNMFL